MTGTALAALAAATSLFATPSVAQDVYGRSQTLLVTPEGDLLGYTPERGEVVVRYDNSGRRILLDRYGNMIAYEMPAEEYFPRRHREPYWGGQVANAPVWEDDVMTGSVPGDPAIERQPLEQALPGFPDDSFGAQEQPEQPMTKKAIPEIPVGKLSRPEVTALQVFLDREGVSPGVIDGKMGQNVNKAIVAWEQITGETLDPNDADGIIERLRLSGGLAFMSYTITAGDAAGPYVAAIPEDYAEKAALPALSYTSTAEMLAEKFHMDEAYLRELNPGVDFTIPGTIIKVVDPGPAKKGSVARIIADKGLKQVFAYGEDGALIAAYPASIGSTDTPSPSGTVTVERIALNPGYTYNPKVNFKQGNNDRVLSIPPGPNGPVGTVWLALSKPTYGIHGTPEPSKIGRTQSHGCIRLTNWDATELAKMVKPGVTVEFID
ncbi:L,D-transpeptidase [Ciceribacter sp. L1K23]|uniref:L,D-transpeptidase family protein n=1 Tax=Ciceribacter sp. L1K23 TaxID=2820276 RepID=UPI001B81D2F1|nr:L,D-transpeptidase [Ciceribacter sp. L1K23]MBR0555052.1 L,D-transpeptidase [Ciceribacter sp. L1K23]